MIASKSSSSMQVLVPQSDAAEAIGCTVSQIAKSLVFKAAESKRPVLIITSGSERVDEEKVSALLKEPIERATAEFVRESTGFAIGGVPPIAHRELADCLHRQDSAWL